jgi:hypothetical protein
MTRSTHFTSPLVGEVGTRSLPGEGNKLLGRFHPLSRLAAKPLATLSHKGRGYESGARRETQL